MIMSWHQNAGQNWQSSSTWEQQQKIKIATMKK
jgi:hypothetical protein